MGEIWRTGRHNGRVIYLQPGPGPDRDTDVMIGAMDTAELARRVCEAVNAYLAEPPEGVTAMGD